MCRLLLLLAWAALLPLSSLAQPVSPDAALGSAATLTLQEAQDAALRRHPDLLAADYEVQATEAGQLQAGTRPNPTLSVELEDPRRSGRNTAIFLNQPIELGGKRAARLDLAQRTRGVALADVSARRAEVRAAVTSAFFDTLIAQERERLAEDSVLLSQRGRQAVSNRVAAGKVSPIEDTRARVAVAGIRVELLKARSELAAARQRLASAMAQPGTALRTLEGASLEMPRSPAVEPFEQRLLQAPTVLRARAEAARASAAIEVERARRRPDLTVSLGARREGESGRQTAVVALSIPLPVFDTNRGAILEAQRRADRAQAELASAQLRLEAEARVTVLQLRSARAEAEVLRSDVLPGAQSAYEATVIGYELGKFGLIEVLDAQRTLLLAKSQVVQSLSSAHRAAADLERLIGEPLNRIPLN